MLRRLTTKVHSGRGGPRRRPLCSLQHRQLLFLTQQRFHLWDAEQRGAFSGVVLSIQDELGRHKEVQYEDPQAADEPGQMFDDEGVFGAPQRRQDHDDAQPVRPVAHHGQSEQQVRGALCGLPLELE